jgi:hypothetical protein
MSKSDAKRSFLIIYRDHVLSETPKIKANGEGFGRIFTPRAREKRPFCSRGIDFPASRCTIYDMTGL